MTDSTIAMVFIWVGVLGLGWLCLPDREAIAENDRVSGFTDRLRRLRELQGGGVAIEFAFTLPIFAALALAGIDLVQLSQAKSGAAALAYQSCSFGARSGTIQQASGFMLDATVAHDKAVANFDANKSGAFMVASTPSTIVVEPLDEDPNHSLKCTVTATVTPLTGFLSSAPRTVTFQVVN